MALWGGRFSQAADQRFKQFMIHCGLITGWQSRILSVLLPGRKRWLLLAY